MPPLSSMPPRPMSMRANAPAGRCAAELPASRLNRLSYEPFRHLSSALFRWYLRIEVEGRPPATGAGVLVANHASFLDPIVLGAACPRRITFMMTQLHYRSARLGWFYRWSRAIPLAVRGGGNRAALRAGRAVLRRGELLAVFPEGGLTRDGGLLLGNPGAVSLALAEDVPVVPVHLGGTYESLPIGGSLQRRGITVRFGTPLGHDQLYGPAASDRRARLQHATAAIMAAIAALGGRRPRSQELAALRTGAG